MRKFEEIEAEYFENNDKIICPMKENYTHWVAYGKGEVLGSFSTKARALSVSKIVEEIVDKENYDLYTSLYYEQRRAINELYHAELRNEFSNLNDETYNLIYSYADDRYGSYSIDDLAYGMIDLEELASEIIIANK